MKTKFASSWKSSTQPRKQRKYLYNAPLHIRNKLVSVNLSKELSIKLGTRNIPIRKEDKVKVLRGQFKGKSGKVERVDHENRKLFIQGIDITKKEGSKTPLSIAVSNVQITELNTSDKKRIKTIKSEEKKNG